jgi:hypothetical protein
MLMSAPADGPDGGGVVIEPVWPSMAEHGGGDAVAVGGQAGAHREGGRHLGAPRGDDARSAVALIAEQQALSLVENVPQLFGNLREQLRRRRLPGDQGRDSPQRRLLPG